MSDAGMLHILTARDGSDLVGHVLMIVRPHLHYSSTVCGFVDTFFLSKRARRGFAGIKMIKAAINHMKSLGASRVFFMTDISADTSAIFARMGFKQTNALHSMWVV